MVPLLTPFVNGYDTATTRLRHADEFKRARILRRVEESNLSSSSYWCDANNNYGGAFVAFRKVRLLAHPTCRYRPGAVLEVAPRLPALQWLPLRQRIMCGVLDFDQTGCLQPGLTFNRYRHHFEKLCSPREKISTRLPWFFLILMPLPDCRNGCATAFHFWVASRSQLRAAVLMLIAGTPQSNHVDLRTD